MKKIVRNRSYSTLRDTRKMQSKLSRLGNSGLTTHFYNKLQGGRGQEKRGGTGDLRDFKYVSVNSNIKISSGS